MKSRDFFVLMPKLCGADDAEREGSVIGFMFDQNAQNESTWIRSEDDKNHPDRRLLNAFRWEGGDREAKAQCFRLVQIMDRKHHIDQGETQYQTELDALVAIAKAAEPLAPEVTAVMTTEQALGTWWNVD
jgi:hypothetical protein